MKKGVLQPVLLVLLFVVLVCIQCSIGPVAGTETGNPDIVACLSTALSEFDTLDTWLPSHYLVEGESQLNPLKVYQAFPTLRLAKKAALPDSTDTLPDQGIVLVYRHENVVRVDSEYINDTIVTDTVVADTVYQKINTDYGETVIAEKMRHDTVIIVDTIVVRDTISVRSVDTMYLTGIDMPVPVSGEESILVVVPSVNSKETLVPRTKGPVVTYFDARGVQQLSYSMVTPSDNVFLSSASDYLAVSQQTTIDGVVIKEVYSDGDGDGFLFKAATSQSARSNLLATYTNATAVTALTVVFDAGGDGEFPATDDNRIMALRRTRSSSGTVVDDVTYGCQYNGKQLDTIAMTRKQIMATGLVTQTQTRYSCIAGSDTLDHKQNRLAALFHSVTFRDERIKKMDITIVLDTLLTVASKPPSGRITAFIDYGKGLTGVVDALINFSAQTVSGDYAENGKEFKFSFDRARQEVDLTPIGE